MLGLGEPTLGLEKPRTALGKPMMGAGMPRLDVGALAKTMLPREPIYGCNVDNMSD